ncbi:MAG: cytochrome b N-terminal domain-containing protein [Geopsychrobacter sp.]|nr:cytochrome b N-terminal domain-containing protein [Geopsychrobacter sp.]
MSRAQRNFLDHLHSVSVSRHALRPTTTWGLGIACLSCLAILFITGFTLFLYYVPDQEVAYERILHIQTTLHFGGLIRNLHFLAANALVILAVLHLSRVFFTGSYKGRILNWQYGLLLLALILYANFTGYLLPWDQISYWAIKVGASLAGYFPLIGPEIKTFLLGGEQIGSETLLRSFALHAGLIPLLLFLTGLHLWRVRKDGGLAAPEGLKEAKLPADPWLFRAEAAVALLTLSVMLLLSCYFDAPIYERADPFHPPNPAKAPWYFIGFQELVSYSALIGGVVIPVVCGLFLVLCPWLDRSKSCGGIWFSRDRLKWSLTFGIMLLAQLLLIAIGLWCRGKNWQWINPF